VNDWVVETPSFEEDLMNDRVVMLNQVGVNRVVEIIKEKDKEIERQKEIIDGMIDNEEKNCLKIDQLHSIIKEIRKVLTNSKEYKCAKSLELNSKMSVLIELEEILDKAGDIN